MQDNIEIGERIIEIRENLNMTRESFSEMVDISTVFLGQIERGEKSLSIKTLKKIIDFSGASADYILSGKEEKNTTIDKITKVLNESSKEGVNFIYELTCTINTFLKNEKKHL